MTILTISFAFVKKHKTKHEYIIMKTVCLCVASLLPCLLIEDPSLFLQLRVIRAFKSTLEDLEERRSVHSLHSLHSMRSSRSHTGPRPLSDFTYIDEDPTNTSLNASKLSHKGHAIVDQSQDHEASNRGSRVPSLNSPASPLLLHVPGTGNVYNHHNSTANNNRSNNILSQPLSPNQTMQTSTGEYSANSLRTSSTTLVLPEMPKLVHETSI